MVRKLTIDEFVLLFKIHQNEKKISDSSKLQLHDEQQDNVPPLNGTWG
jgi:hypothetical protein